MRANVGLLLGRAALAAGLAAGLLMALLLLGLLFGWPLMWATISAEGTDSFDALSRSYAYTFQRPLHYLFYAAVAGLIGWLGWILVQNFAASVVWMSYWAAGWGCGADQIDLIINGGNGLSSSAARAGLIRFWAGCVKLLAVGYLFSYFWTAATAIYFLLRRDVDATEMDEVYLDADASEPDTALPAVAKVPSPTTADKSEAEAGDRSASANPPDWHFFLTHGRNYSVAGWQTGSHCPTIHAVANFRWQKTRVKNDSPPECAVPMWGIFQ